MDYLPILQPELERAGLVALEFFLRAKASLKSDRTVVTEADLAVQDLLVDVLNRNFPDDGIIAEEEHVQKASQNGRYWTVDPIDGTVPFLAGLNSWCIALGLLDAGRPVAGFVYVPTSRDVFHTVPGHPAYRNGRPMELKPFGPPEPQSILLTHSRPHQRYTLAASYPGRLCAMGSASLHLSFVATGAADAVLIGHDKIWDLVPGCALLMAGGGALRYLDGSQVKFEALMDGKPAPQPMLGGDERAVKQMHSYLDYWDPHTVNARADG